MEFDKELMEKKLKRIAFYLILASFGNLTYMDFSAPLGIQILILIPLMLVTFWVIYCFYRGRKWARFIVLAGAFLNIFNLFTAFSEMDTLKKMVQLFDSALGFYLLITLNQKGMRAYFDEMGAIKTSGKKKLGIFLAAAALIATFIAGFGFWIAQVVRHTETSQIWLENFKTGEKQKLSQEKMNSHPSFSPDGKRIAFISRETADSEGSSSLVIYSLADHSTSVLYEDTGRLTNPSWTPDGEGIVFRRKKAQSDLWMIQVKDKTLRRITDDPAVERHAALSPDGKQILFSQEEEGSTMIGIVPVEGGEKTPLLSKLSFLDQPRDLAWTPSSKQIAFISYRNLSILDLETGEKEVIALGTINNPTDVVFYSPDPTLVLVKARPVKSISLGFNLYRISRRTHKIDIWKPDRNMLENDFDLSPDGNFITYSAP